MRYQMFDDSFGNYLIVDTWKNDVIGKATKLPIGARICQKLNRKLGTDEYFQKTFYQNPLTSERL